MSKRFVAYCVALMTTTSCFAGCVVAGGDDADPVEDGTDSSGAIVFDDSKPCSAKVKEQLKADTNTARAWTNKATAAVDTPAYGTHFASGSKAQLRDTLDKILAALKTGRAKGEQVVYRCVRSCRSPGTAAFQQGISVNFCPGFITGAFGKTNGYSKIIVHEYSHFFGTGNSAPPTNNAYSIATFVADVGKGEAKPNTTVEK
jgi:hypothetical protein